MKTPPATTLPRTETGGYVGAVGGQGLTSEQQRAIRKALCNASGPLMIGAIAGRAGIALTTPQLQQSASDFIARYLVETKEVERRMEGTNRKTGRAIFQGFVATEHARILLSKGLV